MLILDRLVKRDVERFFAVFRNNVEDDLHRLLPPTAAALKFQVEFEEELDTFHASVMNRLSQEPTL